VPAPRPIDLAEAVYAGDKQFWFETLRVLGAADYGGAQIGEVLAAAGSIVPGDYDSWYDAWVQLADRVANGADLALRGGHRVSARDGFLRASNYYRSSEFFLHGDPSDARLRRAYERSVACFKHAAALFERPVEPVEIPYERTTLPGYLYRPDLSGRERPAIVTHSGFDGSAEEMHFGGAWAAVERGYNVLSFDGPGQFGALHRENLHFRPDWENVIGPVLDFVLTVPGIDAGRVAILGKSLGGELAPRAAAFERRLAACIANDGLYDLAAPVFAGVPEEHRRALEARFRADDDPEMDAGIEQSMAANPTVRWAIVHGMCAMGVPTPRAYMAASLDYNLGNGIAERIDCPTLVCDSEDDLFFKGQPQVLYDRLRCRKTLLTFTAAEGAGSHCQVGAHRLSAARIFDWLDGVLAHR
jgi:dienelactone hydrolase